MARPPRPEGSSLLLASIACLAVARFLEGLPPLATAIQSASRIGRHYLDALDFSPASLGPFGDVPDVLATLAVLLLAGAVAVAPRRELIAAAALLALAAGLRAFAPGSLDVALPNGASISVAFLAETFGVALLCLPVVWATVLAAAAPWLLMLTPTLFRVASDAYVRDSVHIHQVESWAWSTVAYATLALASLLVAVALVAVVVRLSRSARPSGSS